MKARKYSQIEKDQIIKEIKDCGNVTLVCKKNNIPLSTAHAWVKPRNKKKKLIESSESLQSLKKQLADKDLQIKILEDLLKKTNQAWLGD